MLVRVVGLPIATPLYNVDVSTKTILVHELQQLATRVQLTTTLAASTPGEELVIFNQIPDDNGGQPLPGNPLFGEAVATPPIVIVVPRCIVPGCDGVFSGLEFRTTLWDRYSTAAPAQLRQYGLLSSVVRKAYNR
ncbi:hypothetical protein [Hymenobacter psychrotolerans]|uniref:Uncharacterized protein n=1 Tax=Hymenobacter psychrotolerans DSM 18569 TaxID=1121959 RepID=A0A1M7ENW8_9BACT|nr:hypothetical protein [Hymenobacter psychrotolerans]SHL93491.1 hypothetical protein SAMN02746009_03646 [Hymenobacter psychrotolerans DSM 18569]